MSLEFINAADLVGHWINGQADAGSGHPPRRRVQPGAG